MNRAATKVVVIGLDGIDWRTLQPLLDAGHLPTLGRLVRDGAYGRLQSTVRPESSVAWSTFATGVNPGKHGIFGFVRHQPDSYDYHLADGQHIQASRFWDMLGAAGYRVGLVNVPFTYPPRPVNGFLIGGMLTPGPHVTFTYPPELQARLLARLPQPYLFDAGDKAQNKARLPQGVAAYTEQQLATALMLLPEEAWDCFVIVFTGPDRLQHFFWTDFATDGRNMTAENPLFAHLQQLDGAVSQILANSPADTLLLLVSDHGFNGVNRRFYINRWLQQEGYLATRGWADPVQVLIDWLTRLKQFQLLRRVKRTLLPAHWGAARLRTATFTQPIDWTGTQAYYAPDGGLRINLRGREPMGVVAPIDFEKLRTSLVAKLTHLVDRETGQPPIARVYRPEELYSGPFASQAPDLIVEPHRDQPVPDHNYVLDSKLIGADTVFATAAPYNGNHAPYGILIASGLAVAQQRLSMSQLQDIAPTILTALGVPIPDSMDGQPLLHLFLPDRRPEPQIAAADAFEPDVRAGSGEDHEAAVTERLRNLGYLD